ncbi:PREDICTED: uncharacterized protein LOC106106785 [Papilio polytes]|uniref:uncharacterized protein LOC106106785 n=1 Tax=Papilio polytes TaxID=76194 RepID=UPI000676535C|nr:PREDICTED: uncharacterized protein LOC106106785 [Papilio polytes]
MHWTIFYFCVPVLCCAAVNMKALTESMGQEVIEMDAPIKELPPEIEEEPSAENEADVKSATTISTTKSSTVKETKRRMKETEKPRSNQEEEEARIEKELSDLYKDSSDYKADSAEVTNDTQRIPQTSTVGQNGTEDDALKPVARAREDFKFQPDTNNKADVERFRTSIDVISCDKQRLTGAPVTITPLSSVGHQILPNTVLVIFLKNVLYF